MIISNQIINTVIRLKIRSCYRRVPSAIWEIFSEFLIFFNLIGSHQASELTGKYEKREKYLSILHGTTCDNYFIVKCLLKVYLIMLCIS